MKILVIGGSGFIGTRLIEQLLQRGDEVVNLDLRPSEPFSHITRIGDVRDENAVRLAASDADAIVLLAAEHRDDVRPVERYETVNVDGAQVVADAAASLGIDRIVFTSSVAVYGLDTPLPSEDTEPAPFNEYGRTKLLAEGVLNEWAAGSPKRSLLIVRPCVVFGENNRGNVYNLMKQISARRFLPVGNGGNHKSLSYVGNIVDFLSERIAGEPGTELINYADKPDMSQREIVSAIRLGLGRSPNSRVFLPLWLGLAIGYFFDLLARITRKSLPVSSVRVRKLCAETTIATPRLEKTGHVAKVSLPDALERTVKSEF